MKKTLTEQYRLIKEDKGHKGVFLKEAKKLFPNLIRQGATYNEASKILKQKNIITENFVGLGAINSPFEVKEKEGYENAFENFLKEAKAEEKKVSKEVEEDQSRGYDTADKKDPNNMIFGQIQMGYYCEMKNPKNADKTEQEIKDIVFKNLEKDPIYYTKNGQFGEEGVGYTDDNVSLGIPEEPKGEHKSSGYGKLKEHKLRRRKLIKENITQFEEYIDSNFNASVDQEAEEGFQTGVWAKGEEGNPELYDETEKFDALVDYLANIGGKATLEGNPNITVELLDNGDIKWSADVTLSENTSLNEHSISTVGGIVTGTGFVGMDYREYYGLDEAEDDKDDTEKIKKDLEDIKKSSEEIAKVEMFEEDDITPGSEAPEHMEAVADAVEMAYESGMSTAEIIEFVEQHLGLKMGDY